MHGAGWSLCGELPGSGRLRNVIRNSASSRRYLLPEYINADLPPIASVGLLFIFFTTYWALLE